MIGKNIKTGKQYAPLATRHSPHGFGRLGFWLVLFVASSMPWGKLGTPGELPARYTVPRERDGADITYATGRRLCDLANADIRESSGLAASTRHGELFWTHNDSGDEPRIFAFDSHGRNLGSFSVPGARAYDWEDMASFQLDGRCCLLLADVGDNLARRPRATLYLTEEPEIPHAKPVNLLQIVHFRFEDGPHNCEAVGFDPVRREVLLAIKEIRWTTKVFLMPWPSLSASELLEARHIATVDVPVTTAMDVSPDGLRAVLLTYGHAYEYRRKPDEDWPQALARPGRLIPVPARAQGESICYGRDGKTLYLTSEQRPTPLFEVPVVRRDEKVQSGAHP